MIVFRYDKTLEGLLCTLFDAYNLRMFPERLIGAGEPQPMFTKTLHTVLTTTDNASRVWKGLEKKLPKTVCNMLMHVWLSEEAGCDELLFRYMRKAFDSPQCIADNFADDDMLNAKKLAHKVAREGLFLVQFVRFQKAGDDTYFAPVSPKYNALPLTIEHFADRFADQKWLIYDIRRRYGYYYDLQKATEVTLQDDGHLLDGKLDEKLMAEDEKLFQEMWRGYFKAMTIKERINPKLHRQHLPRRFWKLLTEKQ